MQKIAIGLLTFLILGALASGVHAGDYHVNAATGSDLAGDGSALHPWRTVTHALTQLAGANDVLHVAPGVHDAALGEVFPLVVQTAVSVRGAGPELTIFDGGGTGTLFQVRGLALGSSSDVARLERAGLRQAQTGIQFLASSTTNDGEGRFSELALADITGAGGTLNGFYESLSAQFEGSTFLRCGTGLSAWMTGVGGGMLAADCRFTDCDTGVSANAFTPSFGSGHATLTLERCEIRGSLIGGLAETYDAGSDIATISLIDSLVAGCDTGLEGRDFSDLSLVRSTVSGNLVGLQASGTQPGLVFYWLSNSIVWGNAQSDLDPANVIQSTHSNSSVALGGTADLSVDPRFVDAAAGDLHLAADSPLIDAGEAAAPPGGTDSDVDPRVLDGNLSGQARLDVGWDEFNTVKLSLSASPVLGASFDILTGAPAGHVVCTALAFAEADVSFDALGSALVDPTTAIVLDCSASPTTVTVHVPLDLALAGLVTYTQSLSIDPGSGRGSFSNRVRATLTQP